MNSKNILQNIANKLIRSKNRHHAHSKLKPQFESLCNDKTFIFDALKDCISRSSFWEKPDNLVFPLYLSGDIIIRLGDFEITDIMTYMKALSKFKSGDKTKVVVYREDSEYEFEITFD